MKTVVHPVPANEPPDRRLTGPSWRYVAMLASVLLLMLTGTVAVLLASTPTAIVQQGDAFATFGRHATWVTIAVLALLFTLNRDYRSWRRWAPTLVVVATLGLVWVKVSGRVGGGSRRWLDFGPFNVQPSEIVKFALVLGIASFLDQRRYFLDRVDRVTLPITIWLAVVCYLIYRQPDLGTAVILACIAL
ncbi:MAG: FtsW/RodA/SpoVE family cell cycle protein, partial [Actinomycetota bacterium]|nr:FtsW/RodA/SpoVE family cell cycle protein [Actinomycetota bacterium]